MTSKLRNVVAMVALPSPIRRGRSVRRDLRHLPYAMASWQSWCKRHGVEFVLVERVDGRLVRPDAPATYQRWFAAGDIVSQRAPGTRLALVDSDTMIRWDAPNLFDHSPAGLGAVRGKHNGWIRESISAYQNLFPNVVLEVERYFNAGMVVLGSEQLEFLATFCGFYSENDHALEAIALSHDVGTDQTPLNFVAVREHEPVKLLDDRFNMLACFGMPNEELARLERRAFDSTDEVSSDVRLRDEWFGFIDKGYIWHFTNTFATRRAVMAETWRRVERNYS